MEDCATCSRGMVAVVKASTNNEDDDMAVIIIVATTAATAMNANIPDREYVMVSVCINLSPSVRAVDTLFVMATKQEDFR